MERGTGGMVTRSRKSQGGVEAMRKESGRRQWVKETRQQDGEEEKIQGSKKSTRKKAVRQVDNLERRQVGKETRRQGDGAVKHDTRKQQEGDGSTGTWKNRGDAAWQHGYIETRRQRDKSRGQA